MPRLCVHWGWPQDNLTQKRAFWNALQWVAIKPTEVIRVWFQEEFNSSQPTLLSYLPIFLQCMVFLKGWLSMRQSYCWNISQKNLICSLQFVLLTVGKNHPTRINLDSSGNNIGLNSIQTLCLVKNFPFRWHCARRKPKLDFAAAFTADNQQHIF